jgi:D-alanyl-D-alanine carboxypeptidase/D-alanyl-D-alanine-endopeptidase (penicillin-binding protein 4)
MKARSILILGLSVLLLVGCSAPWATRRDDRLEYVSRSADKLLNNSLLRGASWSILAIDLETGRILLSRTPERTLIPGSGMKLLITACALETLGPEYRTYTTVGYTGEIASDGTLNGDLVVVGAGDPTLASRYRKTGVILRPADTLDTFTAWADSLRAKGITRINGGLIGVNGLFGGRYLGSGWEWDDLSNWYAAEIDPLTYADNCIEFTITPGDSVGAAAGVVWTPSLAYGSVNAQIITGDGGGSTQIQFDRSLGGNQIVLRGTIRQGSAPEKRWIATHDPAAFFLTNLREKLNAQGIPVTGEIQRLSRWNSDDPNYRLLFVQPSPKLSQILSVINQRSVNLYSELLLRLLGDQYRKSGNSGAGYYNDPFESGRQCVMDWDAKLTGYSTGFLLVDGSGLSRRNLISADGLIKVLAHMNRSPQRDEFAQSLASPGIGTLEGRFVGLPEGISLHAKTGSLSRVRSLAGYLGQGDRNKIAFAIICNHYLCAPEEVDQTLENLTQLLALYLKGEASH